MSAMLRSIFTCYILNQARAYVNVLLTQSFYNVNVKTVPSAVH